MFAYLFTFACVFDFFLFFWCCVVIFIIVIIIKGGSHTLKSILTFFHNPTVDDKTGGSEDFPVRREHYWIWSDMYLAFVCVVR